MSKRCQQCASLNVASLRGQHAYLHHESLSALKSCADTEHCDLCTLFCEALSRTCNKRDISNYLQGRPGDPMNLQDTAIYLADFLQDFDFDQIPTLPKSGGGSSIGISSGPLDSSRVHTGIGIFADPSKQIFECASNRIPCAGLFARQRHH